MQSEGTGLYEVIAERAPIGLLVLDEDGVVEWTNDEYVDLLGIPREELLDTPFADLVDAGYYDQDVVEKYVEAVRRLLASGNDADRESYLVRTHLQDETLVHDVSTALLPLADGEFRGTVHAFRDVTTQKAYERELARQNERLEEFASVVSHDLRNPLTVASGHLDLAMRDDDPDALERVRAAHERMEALVDDLLSLARSGEQVRDADPVDVADVARHAWRSVRTGDAELAVADGLGRVDADETRVRQLFENLFRNSVEHGRADVVTVGPLDDRDGFYVADDGPGIPDGERERVFERGYTTTQEGTGLGLTIVQSIVDAHGWTVAVADAPGARFEVTTSDSVPL